MAQDFSPVFERPPRRTVLLRGLKRQCPRCAQDNLFTSTLNMKRRCPHCHLEFERNPGAFIGGIGVNTTVTFILIIIAIVASFLLISSDHSVWWRILPGLVIALTFPVAFFASSKMLWIAIEYIWWPPAPGE